MMTPSFLSVGLLALLASRSVYRVLADGDVIERDAFAHFLLADQIRENGHRLPTRPDRFVTAGVIRYPPLLHVLLSFVPRRWFPALDRHFSALADLAYAGLLAALVPAGLLAPGDLPLALALFVATPEFSRPNMAQSLGVSARKPGLLLTTATLLSFVLALSTGSLALGAVAVLLAATPFLTSKFSVQAFLFVALALSLATPLWLLLYVAGFAVAVAVSGGYYYALFRGHVTFLYNYAVEKQFKTTATNSPLNPLRAYRRADDLREFAESMYWNPFVRVLPNNPFVAVVGVTLALATARGVSLGVPRAFLLWIAGSYGAFLLTSLPYLRFLGEGERYLGFGFLPSAVVVVAGWHAFGPGYRLFVLGALAAGVVVLVAYVPLFDRLFDESERNARFREVCRFLDGESGTVLVQPLWRGRELVWRTDADAVDFLMNGETTPESVEQVNRMFPAEYGYLTDDAAWLAEEFDPDWAVFDRDELDGDRERTLQPPPSPPAFENESFSVYPFGALVSDGSAADG